MKKLFSDRITNTPKSFIREILKVTENPKVISFAGGLPNSMFFPVKEVSDAALKVLKAMVRMFSSTALQKAICL